ncbi:uncharacterized protein LOC114873880 isoform X2 [Osmia bicornis bicornis]|uniref:uncharacterized protein LOC114873880 isoform X2 n=1 Tax=Osmia bicornis bicornis TaxID=1437191 RepID=UPI0010F57FD5|nr:uncharacterized protein LOC114873880 isoform X2 [Osmia bicornis bicornis]
MTEPPLHEWVVPFRELLNVQKNYLKCSGIWIIDPKRSSFLQSAYLLYKGWMLSAMYIFAITLFADIYDNVDNLSITTDDGCIFAGMLVVIFKAMNYQIRRNKIARFVSETLKCVDDLSKFSRRRNSHGARLQGPTPRKENK